MAAFQRLDEMITTLAAVWFWRRAQPPAAAPPAARPLARPESVAPVLLPWNAAGRRLAIELGLDPVTRAAIQPDLLWLGPVPGYTAVEAVQTLATIRLDTAALVPLQPGSAARAARSAEVVAGALRAAFVLSGRLRHEQLRDGLAYVASDLPRRLDRLAEAVVGPSTWAGVGNRAQWTGLVAEYAGLQVSDDLADGLVSLAPQLEKLYWLCPRPGANPAPAACRLIEPVLVAAVQRVARWAVVAAALLLQPHADPRQIDSSMAYGWDPPLLTPTAAVDRLSSADSHIGHRYGQLTRAETTIIHEIYPSKTAGGHMDVRPDEDAVAELLWQAEAAAAAIAVLCRRLEPRSGPLASLAQDAIDLLEAAAARGASWPDEAVTALRRGTDLALVLTASSVSG